MSRRSRLKQEAAQMRGRVDGHARFVRRRIDSLMRQGQALARSPAALPVAFLCGMLAERLSLADIKHSYKALQIVFRFIPAPV